MTRRADALFYGALAVWLVYLLWRAAHLPLQEWDEARNVLNAYEMTKSGDWVAMRYGGELDHYNLKPPLFMWTLAVLFATAGYSDLTARIPSIVFGLATAVLVYRFLRCVTSQPWIAAVTSLGLVSVASRPFQVSFYGFHGLTSGDVDMALVFFATLAFVAVHRIAIGGRPRGYLLLGAALGLGALTKSLVGMLPAGLLLVALAVRRDRPALVNPWLPAGVAIAVAIVAPWLVLRETRYPDHYLSLAVGTDIVKRTGEVLESHAGDLWFYWDALVEQTGAWLYLALFAAFMLAEARLRRAEDAVGAPARRAGVYAALTVVFYLLAFSIPASKLRWYIFPAVPPLFVLAGVGLSLMAQQFNRRAVLGLAATLLVSNVFGVLRYDVRRPSGNPLVDHLLEPYADLLRGQELITQGDLRQNGFALTRIYSGLRATHFPEPTPLDEMLRRAPDAAYLVTADAAHYAGDRRLEPVLGVTRDRARGPTWAIFRIRRGG
jgi:4-amino-4-deoxy-L-arabinose transferase-like glycosyltransferase